MPTRRLARMVAERQSLAARKSEDALRLLRMRQLAEAPVTLQPQLPVPAHVVDAVLTPTVAEVTNPPRTRAPLVAHFLTPLCIRKVGEEGGRPLWVLISPLTYHSLVLAGVGYAPEFTVPAGYPTDLTSAPRLPLVFLFAGDTAHAPAALHDYLYRTKLFTRKVADAVMNEAMGIDQPELGIVAVPTWRRVLMVGSLRAMGWWVWNRIVVAAT